MVKIKIDDLTIAEIGEVERLAKMPFTNISDSKAPKGALLQALAFVMKRRDEPGFTYKDAGQLTFTQVNEIVFAADPEDAEVSVDEEGKAGA